MLENIDKELKLAVGAGCLGMLGIAGGIVGTKYQIRQQEIQRRSLPNLLELIQDGVDLKDYPSEQVVWFDGVVGTEERIVPTVPLPGGGVTFATDLEYWGLKVKPTKSDNLLPLDIMISPLLASDHGIYSVAIEGDLVDSSIEFTGNIRQSPSGDVAFHVNWIFIDR